MRAPLLLLATLCLDLASAGAAETQTAPPMVIALTYDSVMDMVRPEMHPNLHVHHNLSVTISAGGGLAENRNRSIDYLFDKNATVQELGPPGPTADYVAWHVAPDGKLVRIQQDPQSTRTMIVTLLPGKQCRLDVSDQLKPGFSEYSFLRVASHSYGYFSTYRVVATSCAIR
jgi:hypothetical protein